MPNPKFEIETLRLNSKGKTYLLKEDVILWLLKSAEIQPTKAEQDVCKQLAETVIKMHEL